MSRGHDAAHRLRPPDAHAAEQLAVGDHREAVRASLEAAVEAPLDQRDGSRRRRLRDPADDPDGMPGLAQELGEARRLVRHEHDARPLAQPVLDAVDQALRPARRQHGLPPAEEVARRQALRRVGHPLRLARLGLPGELQGPRAVEAGLPVPRREEGLRPVPGQLALLHQLAVAFLGLAPQEVGGLREVARLVEDEQGAGVEVVEARGRGDEPRPHLGRVARGQRASRRDRRGPLGRGLAGEPCQVQGEALGQPSRQPAEACPDRVRPSVGQQELGRRQERDLADGPHGPLVGRVEGAQRVDLVAEELHPDRQRRRRREHVHDAAAPGELAPARHLEHRRVPTVEELRQERLQPDARPRPQRPERRGQVVRREGGLEQRLDAGDEHLGRTVPPRRQRRHPCGRLVGHQLRALVGERRPRLQDGDQRRVAQPRPQLLGHPVADLRVPGNPADPLGDRVERERRGEEGLRPVRDRRQSDVPAVHRRRRDRTEPLAEGREGARRVEQAWQRRQVRNATPRPSLDRAAIARPRRRGSSRPSGAPARRRPQLRSAFRAAGSRSSTSASAEARSRSTRCSLASAAARRSAHSRATRSATLRWRVVRPRYRSLNAGSARPRRGPIRRFRRRPFRRR